MRGGSGVVNAPVRRTFNRFWPYARQNRWSLLLAALLLVLAAAASAVGIWMFGRITDDAVGAATLEKFWEPAGIWVAMTVAGGVASYAGGRLTAWVAECFLLRLRDTVYGHLQRMSPQFFEDRDTGDLLARLTGDIEAVEHGVSSGVVGAISAAFTVVCYAVAALILNWQLTLGAFVAAPLLWLASRFFSRKLKVASRAERDSNGAISGVIGESLDAIGLVQTYNQQAAEQRRVHETGSAWMRAKLREAKLTSLYLPLIDTVQTVSMLAVIGAGIWEISQHRLTVGGLLALAGYLGYLYPPLQQLGTLTLTMNAATASADRISELLDTPPDVADRPQARPLGRAAGHVAFQRVTHSYPKSTRPSLCDLSFEARPGQFVLVTGGSGAGKSTLARLLPRFADPSAGRILLDGVDLRGVTLESLRDNVALVHQEAITRQGTVGDNIAYGRPHATDEEIRAAARAADAHEFVQHLPQGYHTVLEHRSQRLSGGQRQRLALARALVRDTPVLVLDEPTASLDAEATQRVLRPLRQLAHTRTVILISHDLSLGPLADMILVLEQGQLIEQGTHHELMRAHGRYAQLHSGSTGHPPAPAAPSLPQRGTLPASPRSDPWPRHAADLPTVRLGPPILWPAANQRP